MRLAGLFLTLVGTTAYLYPVLLGRKSLVMSLFGKHEKYSTMVVLGLGLLLLAVAFGMRRRGARGAPAP